MGLLILQRQQVWFSFCIKRTIDLHCHKAIDYYEIQSANLTSNTSLASASGRYRTNRSFPQPSLHRDRPMQPISSFPIILDGVISPFLGLAVTSTSSADALAACAATPGHSSPASACYGHNAHLHHPIPLHWESPQNGALPPRPGQPPVRLTHRRNTSPTETHRPAVGRTHTPPSPQDRPLARRSSAIPASDRASWPSHGSAASLRE